MIKDYTIRGFKVYKIFDTSGKIFEIQKSSDAEHNCIWIGNNHFNRLHIFKILLLLIKFVITGKL